MATSSAAPSLADRKPLRILSLDGGGIRGLASLYILQELMDRIKVEKRLNTTPKPCDWFDLILGTSTGGLIALMIGRLKMPVNDAIEAYQELAEKIFTEKAAGRVKWLIPASAAAKYEEKNFEDAVRKIAGDQKLADPEWHPKCRVAVVARQELAADSPPELLRTYQTQTDPFICTIVEAARATSAATTFFSPARIKIRPGLVVTYIDGGLGCNNPTEQADPVILMSFRR